MADVPPGRTRRRRFFLAAFALVALALALLLVRATPLVPFVRYFAAPRRAVVPVAGLRLERISSDWGAPRSGGRRHEGVDLFARRGTPVLSATRAEVLRVGINPLGGNIVWTIGEDAALYYYAHLDRVADDLGPGRTLRPGDVIGYVGNTGNAIHTPPHLHFGVYPLANSFRAVDPVPLLRRWDAATLDGRPRNRSGGDFPVPRHEGH